MIVMFKNKEKCIHSSKMSYFKDGKLITVDACWYMQQCMNRQEQNNHLCKNPFGNKPTKTEPIKKEVD